MLVVLKAVSAWQLKLKARCSVASDSVHPYTRDQRIVKTDEFSSVFRLRPIYRTPHFVLYARQNDLACARLGVVVAKRFAARAVTRNSVKRVARELFRQSELPAVDCIVRLSRPVNTRSDSATNVLLKRTLREEMSQLFAFMMSAKAFARK
jgi:ribonuclease P protein component